MNAEDAGIAARLEETANRSRNGHPTQPVGTWPLLGCLSAYTVLLGAVFRRIGTGGYGDVDRYIQMARHPGADVGSPWRFRLLTPAIAGFLAQLFHMDTLTAFRVFNGATLVLSALLLMHLLQQIGYEPTLSLTGVAFFVFSYAYTANVGAGAWVDPFLYLTGITVLLLLASPRRGQISAARLVSLTAVLFIGVLNKETALLFLPAVFLALEDGTRFGRLRALRLTALAGLPAIVAYVAVRTLSVSSGEGYLRHYTPTRLTDTIQYWLRGPGLGLYYCCGFLWPLLYLSRRAWPPFAKRMLPLIIVLLPLNLLATDVARTMSAILPIVILATLAYYTSLHQRLLVASSLATYWGAMSLPELLDPGWRRKLARAVFSLAGIGIVFLMANENRVESGVLRRYLPVFGAGRLDPRHGWRGGRPAEHAVPRSG